MPTTQVTEITASVDAVAARTNSAGTGVSPDWKAEEKRLSNLIQTAGIINPTNGFQVVAGGGGTMNIVVGSGPTKVDKAALIGTVAGQEAYIVRMDEAAKTIALDAAHASLARVDEVYLVVYDNAYDATSRVLPRLVVRKGDNGGGNPGVDAAWKASILLNRITIPGGAANIAACTFSDQRTVAKMYDRLAHLGSAGSAHDAATIAVAGFMSAADKDKLDGHKLVSGVLADVLQVDDDDTSSTWSTSYSSFQAVSLDSDIYICTAVFRGTLATYSFDTDGDLYLQITNDPGGSLQWELVGGQPSGEILLNGFGRFRDASAGSAFSSFWLACDGQEVSGGLYARMVTALTPNAMPGKQGSAIAVGDQFEYGVTFAAQLT